MISPIGAAGGCPLVPKTVHRGSCAAQGSMPDPEALPSTDDAGAAPAGSSLSQYQSRRDDRTRLQNAIHDVATTVAVTQEIVGSVEQSKPYTKYLPLRSLGRGAHSTVQLVQRKKDSRLLVIKRWAKSGPEAMREAVLLGSLHHPNIVRVHEHFVHPETSQLCIVMDFAAGGDLQKRIDKCRASDTIVADSYALRILVQLCMALAHIHARGVMHRDIKPANVFITTLRSHLSGGQAGPTGGGAGSGTGATGGEADGDEVVLAYLGDFSVSTRLQGLDLAQTITGTPYCTPPPKGRALERPRRLSRAAARHAAPRTRALEPRAVWSQTWRRRS